MQHPTIAFLIAHARQQDIERGLGRPDRMARRELELERAGRVRRPGRPVAAGWRMARPFPEPVRHKDNITHTDRMDGSGDLR
jgi:hypothetical protein